VVAESRCRSSTSRYRRRRTTRETITPAATGRSSSAPHRRLGRRPSTRPSGRRPSAAPGRARGRDRLSPRRRRHAGVQAPQPRPGPRRQGRTTDGFDCPDDVMLAVTAGDVGPITAGIVHSVLLKCMAQVDLARAAEWTTVLDGWCAAQPDLLPFLGARPRNARAYPTRCTGYVTPNDRPAQPRHRRAPTHRPAPTSPRQPAQRAAPWPAPSRSST
jgi:hypothetical protein